MSDQDFRRYVIVGNGFAGSTAAEALRKADPNAEIHLFGDEPYPLYNRISLPPMLRGQIPEAKVMMRDTAYYDERKIALHLRSRVERILPDERLVLADGSSYPYDALLLATGGRPNPIGAPGSEGAGNVFNFQYLDETRAISEALESTKSAVAIGGSFIAYELAEAFAKRGVQTHWLLRGPRFLHRAIDEEAGALVETAALADGVQIHYGQEVASFARSNGVATKVVTKKGLEIEAQCFGVGFGLAMNVEFLNGTGIVVDSNGILCDDRLETNIPGIFAAGDVANFYDPILEFRYRMGTWNNAGAHGKVVAANMAGGDVRYHDVPEYSSLIFSTQTITQFGLAPDLVPEIECERVLDHEKGWYRGLYFWKERLVGGLMLGKGNRAGKRKYVEAIKAQQRFSAAQRQEMLSWTA